MTARTLLIVMVSIIAGFILCACTGFAYVLFAPDTSQADYDACLNAAYDNYLTDWDSACGANGLSSGCDLPLAVANSVDEHYRFLVEQCNRE